MCATGSRRTGAPHRDAQGGYRTRPGGLHSSVCRTTAAAERWQLQLQLQEQQQVAGVK